MKEYLLKCKELFLKTNALNDCNDVKNLLNKEGLNKNKGTYEGYEFRWKSFGGKRGAWSQVNALNEVAMCAITEHITNSFEAILQKYHCQHNPREYLAIVHGAKVEGQPKSIDEAMERYMGYDSKHYFNYNKLDKHSKNTGQFNVDNELHAMSEVFIQHTPSSVKREDTLTIFDHGCGQSPQTLEATMFSSGTDSSKLDFDYLTGRHNMGSKGGFLHQGGRKYQLTASKLADCMLEHSNDPYRHYFSFSLAQVLDEDELEEFGEKSIRNSMLVFLQFKVDGQWIMPMFDGTFEAVQDIEMGGHSVSKFLNANYGTYKKIFNYQTGNGIKKISHLSPASVTGNDAMTRLKAVLNFIYPSVVTPVRFFSPALDKTGGGNTSIMLGLQYELESQYGKIDADKWEIGSINFQGNLVPATIYKYNNKTSLDHTGIIWLIYQNHVMEAPMCFTHSDFKMQSIMGDVLLYVDLNQLPLSLRNKLLTTGREGFRSTDAIEAFRTFLGKEVQAMPEIQNLILSKRKETLAHDHAQFKKIISDIFRPKYKKSLGDGDGSESGKNGEGCDGGKLSNVISWMEVDKSMLQNLASEEDPEVTILTKVVGSCHKTFKLFFNDDAKESFWTKHPMNVEVEFQGENGNTEVLTGQDLFMVKKGNGTTMISVSQSDKFRGESFTAYVKFSPKNSKKCDHPTFEFSIPCLSQYRTKSNGGNSNSTPKEKTHKGKKGSCNGVNIVPIYQESELNKFITSSVVGTENTEELVPMTKLDAFGYFEHSNGRDYAVNMIHPNLKTWKKKKTKEYDNETLDGLYLAFVDAPLTSVESGIRKRQEINKNYKPNLDSLNDEHPHKILHWEVTFTNQIEQAIDKKSK